ncbi:MAG: pyridoxal-phosphate dependent enzyme [Polyangiaceae bacterium]
MRARPSESRRFGHYPTPVQRIVRLSRDDAELWVKRDDLTHPVYGGNKVRKLEVLFDALGTLPGARIATLGAVGSHHVLATTYFGSKVGLSVEAVLFPQPRTDHVVDVLRADLALGLRAFAAPSPTVAVLGLLGRAFTGAAIVPPGASSVTGAMGYVAAARELAAQVRAGTMPEPDLCVVALGSGGTAAGLAAGFAAERMKTRVVGVCILQPAWAAAAVARWLARGCARRLGISPGLIAGRLLVDTGFVGGGYGCTSPEAEDAIRIAASDADLTLDPTYTGKAFACALHRLRPPRAGRVLYWHTLSSAPLAPFLALAPPLEAVRSSLRQLLTRPREFIE